jgi:large subunit ribosomal protein L35
VPKQKTKKAVSKRFKLTKTGKVKRRHQMTGHFMCAKTAKRRRNLRRTAIVPGKIAVNLAKLMK